MPSVPTGRSSSRGVVTARPAAWRLPFRRTDRQRGPSFRVAETYAPVHPPGRVCSPLNVPSSERPSIMDGVKEVQVGAVPAARLAPLLVEGRAEVLADQAQLTSRQLAGRTVWNVSSTSRGGGVAEMLQTMLAYGRGAGVDTRWLVIDGTPAF